MAKEIERKFLVNQEIWKPKDKGSHIVQGFLCTVPERTVRVRIRDREAWLTIKGKNEGICRAEYDYPIPVADAEELMLLCEPVVIEKRRYLERFEGFLWEIDVFEGENTGLVMAEIELPTAETCFRRPEWVGQEVSDDCRYYNSSLSRHPYRKW